MMSCQCYLTPRELLCGVIRQPLRAVAGILFGVCFCVGLRAETFALKDGLILTGEVTMIYSDLAIDLTTPAGLSRLPLQAFSDQTRLKMFAPLSSIDSSAVGSRGVTRDRSVGVLTNRTLAYVAGRLTGAEVGRLLVDSKVEKQEAESRQLAEALGHLLRSDYGAAIHPLETQAEAGNTCAQVVLGMMYSSGDVLPLNEARAESYLRKASGQGDADAQLELALLLFYPEQLPIRLEEGRRWWVTSITNGSADAAYLAGSRYQHGYGHFQKDVHKAVACLTIASDRGHGQASLDLAEMLVRSGNAQGAVKFFERAAERGHSSASHALATFYFNQRDQDLCLKWCIKGATAGDRQSQLLLAELYANGKGTKKDLSESVRWLFLAGATPHEALCAILEREGLNRLVCLEGVRRAIEHGHRVYSVDGSIP